MPSRLSKKSALLPLSLAVAAVSAILLSSSPSGHAAGGSFVNTVDSGGQFQGLSMALDASGNPVASYYNRLNADLKILHCNDSLCAGGDESLVTADSGGAVNIIAIQTALKLDVAGNPVVTYFHLPHNQGGGTFTVKVLHCNDPNCAGGNESIASPDTAGIQDCCARSWYTAMALDASGNPVITYAEGVAGLTVLHCNDVNCAGNNESVTTNAGTVNVDGNALRLDGSGNPVVAFAEFVNGGDIRLLHCNDSNCAGGDESITTFATLGDATEAFVSMVLDGSGNPVVTYNNEQSIPRRLIVVHCNDSNCAGGDESATTPDDGGTQGQGQFSSIALNGAGNPVISYDQGALGTVAIMRCNDLNCAGGDETITLPRGPTFCATRTTALALDGAGNAVVAYACGQGQTLEVLHCPDATCVGADSDSDGTGAVLDGDDDNDGCADTREAQSAAGSEVSGGRRSVKSFWDFFQVPPRDGSVASTDIFAVLGRFNSSGDPNIDPLSAPPASPAYHPAFDRGTSSGPNPWNLTAANGSIASTDIFAVLGQFNHSCV